jgi:hypothetical protein
MHEIAITTFGYLHSPAPAAHITLDLREHFRDPHVSPELRYLTARDAAVHAAVLATPGIVRLLDAAAMAVLAYRDGPGHEAVTVAVGCAGGRHRAAVAGDALATTLAEEHGLAVALTHRDLDKPVVTRAAEEVDVPRQRLAEARAAGFADVAPEAAQPGDDVLIIIDARMGDPLAVSSGLRGPRGGILGHPGGAAGVDFRDARRIVIEGRVVRLDPQPAQAPRLRLADARWASASGASGPLAHPSLPADEDAVVLHRPPGALGPQERVWERQRRRQARQDGYAPRAASRVGVGDHIALIGRVERGAYAEHADVLVLPGPIPAEGTGLEAGTLVEARGVAGPRGYCAGPRVTGITWTAVDGRTGHAGDAELPYPRSGHKYLTKPAGG